MIDKTIETIVANICHAAIDSSSQPLRRTRRQNEVDIITDERGGAREVDIITGRSGNLDEIDVITDGEGFSEVDIIRGGRRRGTARRIVERRVVERRRPTTTRRRDDTEIDIITGGRRSGLREIDILTGDRRSGVREIDILTGDRRSGVREIDIIRRRPGERRTTTTTTTRRRSEVDDILEERRPSSRRVIDEGIDAVEVDKFKPMPYKFQYIAPNHKSTVERSEEGDVNGVVRGFYRMDLGNGLFRYVDYIADSGGYRAAIRSNEPGIGGGTNIALDLDETPKDLKERDLDLRAASEADDLGRSVYYLINKEVL
ncbi:Cuticle protein 10.9-like protein [Leptotrombidium deliense]|uniref:Cuticle protein 10.9-like protein n=1 Tax=Leptotrombidium deliense TaxID=299467 RepID=A0A443SVJ8_9ACAR|nr:Cuticle protein 10.9-like protein [Leptotrombidium deliense]